MQIQTNTETLAACLSSLEAPEQNLGVKLSHETALETVLNNTTEAFAHLERYDLAVGTVFLHTTGVEVARKSGKLATSDQGDHIWGANIIIDDTIPAGRAVLVVEDGEVDPESLKPQIYTTT